MATTAKLPSAHTAVSSTGWPTNTAYVWDEPITGATYASCAPAKNGTNSGDFTGFGFDSAIPAGSTINSVTIDGIWRVSSVASIETLGVQAFVGGSGQGTELTKDDFAAANTDYTFSHGVTGLTRDNLLNANFAVRMRASRGNTNTSYTAYLKYVRVTVDYTEGAPEARSGTATSVTAVGALGTATGTRTVSSAAAAVTAVGALGTAVGEASVQGESRSGTAVAVAASATIGTAAGTRSGAAAAVALVAASLIGAATGARAAEGTASSVSAAASLGAAAGTSDRTGTAVPLSAVASLGAATGAPPPAAGAHRYWRLLHIGQTARDYLGLAEIELRATAGGADLTAPGGAITASAAYSGWPPSQAIDNDTGTGWTTYTAYADGQWLAYDFGAGNAYPVVELHVTPRQEAIHYAEGPTNFDWQWSDNGTDWTTQRTVSGVSWPSQTPQTINVAAAVSDARSGSATAISGAGTLGVAIGTPARAGAAAVVSGSAAFGAAQGTKASSGAAVDVQAAATIGTAAGAATEPGEARSGPAEPVSGAAVISLAVGTAELQPLPSLGRAIAKLSVPVLTLRRRPRV